MLQAGSMLCLHFERGELNSCRDLRSDTHEANKVFFLAMLDQGILMPVGRMVLLSVAHKDGDAARLIGAIKEGLRFLQDRDLI